MKKLLCLVLAVAFVFSAVGVSAADELELTAEQQNSLNMLNYLAVMSRKIDQSKNNRLYMEEVYSELVNNTVPSTVNSTTKSRLMNMLDTIEKYRMIDVKADRLTYIYEQNKAQAMRSALPNPVSLLSAVASFDMKRLAASVAYMVIDSVTSYQSAMTDAELEYLQDGWELEDEAAEALHVNRKSMFSYMISMVNENKLPDELALTEEAVDEFVDAINNTNLDRRIQFLETNAKKYRAYGEYWLVLAKTYYENGDYEKCLEAVSEYEKLDVSIFRLNSGLAEVLPDAVAAAYEAMSQEEYVAYAEDAIGKITENIGTKDWSLRFYAAETYVQLYTLTQDEAFLEKAYALTLDNVTLLVKEQETENAKYLAKIVEAKNPDGATKQQKKEVKSYNKMLKEIRKTELAPVYEPLLMNCELLFAIADKITLTEAQKQHAEGILRGDSGSLFLIRALDNKYSFKDNEAYDGDRYFNGKEFIVPAEMVSSTAVITATLYGTDGTETVIDDWKLDSVDRRADGDIAGFTAVYASKTAKKHDFEVGEKLQVTIVPVEGYDTETYTFTFECIAVRGGIGDILTKSVDAVKDKKSISDIYHGVTDAATFEEVTE